MKRVWIRWAIFIGVFIVSLFVSNIILNQGTTDMTVEMQEATLPVISVLYDSEPVNTMYGYTKRFDNGTMRESLSPVGEDRSLRIMVDTCNAEVTGVAYEIRSVDGSRLIENTISNGSSVEVCRNFITSIQNTSALSSNLHITRFSFMVLAHSLDISTKAP